MSIQLVIVAVYIALLFGISFYVKSRANKNPMEYLFAGRSLGAVLIGLNITGLAVGAASTVGVAESATKVGLAAGWYNGAWAAGAIAMGLFAAGKYRAMGCSTIPELFERSYDKRARLICAISLAIVLVCITSLQYVAGGAILSSLMPDIFTMKSGMMMSAVVFIGITIVGGLWSSGLSNILSVTLIYLGILYSCISVVGDIGGLDALEAALPQKNFGWMSPMGGLGLATIMSWMVVMITQAISGPAVHIACSAKDSKTARNGFLLGGALIFPVGFLSAVLGMAAMVKFPDVVPAMALPKIIMSLDPFASGITLAAMWAADVSTACTILLAAGTLISNDIYKRFFNPEMKEESFLRVNHIIILLVGISTLWMAFNAVGIVKTMLMGLSLTAAFTMIFFFTVLAPDLCRKSSAFYCTLAGLLALPVWRFVPAMKGIFGELIYFEWAVCLAVFFVVMAVDKEKITPPAMNHDE